MCHPARFLDNFSYVLLVGVWMTILLWTWTRPGRGDRES
jgi:hypothetical protein